MEETYKPIVGTMIGQIADLMYKINSAPTEQESTGNLPTVFFEFSGHVCQVEFRIHLNGWIENGDWDFEKRINLDRNNAAEELTKLIDVLFNILDQKRQKLAAAEKAEEKQ